MQMFSNFISGRFALSSQKEDEKSTDIELTKDIKPVVPPQEGHMPVGFRKASKSM